jgi:hypothetical protein
MAKPLEVDLRQNKKIVRNNALDRIIMRHESGNHSECNRARAPSFTQTILTSKLGLLTISPPAPIQHHRTPAPHAVRRIANMPTAGTRTSNPSLTTFLRFPAEIRLKIYRLLLRYDGVIQHNICPVTLHLVARDSIYSRGSSAVTTTWIRHGLFPSILECCRLINREGSAVLYGENWFWIGHCPSGVPVSQTWGLARRNVASITMLSLAYDSCDDLFAFSQDPKLLVAEPDLFPRIKQLKIHLNDFSIDKWDAFLGLVAARLKEMRSFMLEIDISQRAGTTICKSNTRAALKRSTKEVCLRAYEPTFRKHEEIWNGRQVRWEFDECMNDYARCHCVLGYLRVFLDC